MSAPSRGGMKHQDSKSSQCAEQSEHMSSALSWRSAFPPVVGWPLPDHGRGNLHWEVVAELPQFFCSAGVLEENSIDVERIKLASTVAIDGFPDTRDQFSQLRVVIVRDHRARGLTLRLASHGFEATHRASPTSLHFDAAPRGGMSHGWPQMRPGEIRPERGPGRCCRRGVRRARGSSAQPRHGRFLTARGSLVGHVAEMLVASMQFWRPGVAAWRMSKGSLL
jgi:hypothetical protein